MKEIIKLDDTRQASDRCPQEAGAAQPAGVLSSNTPPLNSKSDWVGGEDWLEWCLYVEWGDQWDEIVVKLNEAKERAGDQKECKVRGFDLIQFGLYEVQVYPSGVSRGKKGKGLYMAFRLQVEGLIMQIAKRVKSQGEQPNVVIRAGGTECLQLGGLGCLNLGRAIVGVMGGNVMREKLSRVDMCLDLPDVLMDEFVVAYHEKRYICRAHARSLEESNGITLYLGKPPLRLRIYDKKAQLQMCGDMVKVYLMKERRWGGRNVENAIRVEFEIGRDALKENGIDTPDDYFKKRSDLISYLCNDWIRFTVGNVDRTNTTRAAVWPMWQKIKEGFCNWAGIPQGLSLEALERGPVDVGQLLKQAAGVLLTAACNQGISPDNTKEFLAYATNALKATIGGMNLKSEIARRNTALLG
ncbi:MAG: hypothetical protein A2283_20935 [Lentisphaerae bacterium RIFOXYA12_FULL_48_11]|nr:MAG: hypothetical protein A2283_20935 [Lentisphaerae bacterium RIFOXYA12_FULL_48_11]